MNEDQIHRSYSELRETLAGLGLSWVVLQVEETIRAGRGVEKETRMFKDEEPLEQAGTLWEDDSAARRPGRPTFMMASEP
jgi:hypothetical protein